MSFRPAIVLSCLMVFQNPRPTESLPHPAKQPVIFAQLTDDHVFDDGKTDDGKPAGGTQPYVQAMDDRMALRWAVDQINVLARRMPIEFVAHTGDFGLENVDFSQSGCQISASDSKNGLPPFPFQVAVDELALELDRLSVHKVYVVPGNNDLAGEKVTDAKRFDCFIKELHAKLRSMTNHVELEALGLDTAVHVGGLRLAGLDTASFKAKDNYDKACPVEGQSAPVPRGCPAPQMESLARLLDAGEAPLLVFTHIPDLIDPYVKSKNPSLKTSAWQIDDGTRRLWLTQASKNKLLGIFAGHFHWDQKEVYATTSGTRYLFADAGIGGKTWVAPPLAGKKQRDKSSQARGFMLVTVDPSSGSNIVTADPVWYPTLPATISASTPTPTPTPSPNDGGIVMSASLRLLGVIIALILVSGSFGGYLSHLLNRRDNPGGPQPGRWWTSMFLGIGAASLVPLFLKLIGSDIVPDGSADANFNVSKVLEFFGFCLLAAMSGRTFITTVSDRFWRKEVEKTANDAKDQAAQANFIAAQLVEPQESLSGHEIQRAAEMSEEETRILRLLNNPEYVLRAPNGLAAEADVAVSAIGETLEGLKRKGWADTTPFAGADRIQKIYWYITAEGRQALKAKEQNTESRTKQS